MTDFNSLAYWFPKIEFVEGLMLPTTRIVQADCDLSLLLDGEEPRGFAEFMVRLMVAAIDVRADAPDPALFLRTGHGSGKHRWEDTCYWRVDQDPIPHVRNLVEWSYEADMLGLPVNDWAVREIIPTHTLFHAWGEFPVTREFRVFVRDDRVEQIQAYWPAEAVEEGRPSAGDWVELLERASKLGGLSRELIESMALKAAQAVGGGYWSVDFLQARDGMWWLIDMAQGDRSYKGEPV